MRCRTPTSEHRDAATPGNAKGNAVLDGKDFDDTSCFSVASLVGVEDDAGWNERDQNERGAGDGEEEEERFIRVSTRVWLGGNREG